MMEFSFKTPNGCLVKVSGCANEKDLFRAVAGAQSVFAAEGFCGLCKSTDLGYRVNTDREDHEYFYLICNVCSAQFRFGQTRKGSLFPKRLDDDTKAPLPDGGWHIWRAQPSSAPSLISRPRPRPQNGSASRWTA